MRIKLIKTGDRKVDSMLNKFFLIALKHKRRQEYFKEKRKLGIERRKSINRQAVRELERIAENIFPDVKKISGKYKTPKGYLNNLKKITGGLSFLGDIKFLEQNWNNISSVEQISKPGALTRFKGYEIDTFFNEKFRAHAITDNKLKREIIEKYFESEQWKLHRTWRRNRDEAKLSRIIDEGIRTQNFDKLDVGKYKESSLSKSYYDKTTENAIYFIENRRGRIMSVSERQKYARWIRYTDFDKAYELLQERDTAGGWEKKLTPYGKVIITDNQSIIFKNKYELLEYLEINKKENDRYGLWDNRDLAELFDSP